MIERKHRLPLAAYKGEVAVFYTCCLLPKQVNVCDQTFFELLIKQLSLSSERYQCTVPIVTLMPNHFHTIIRGIRAESDTWQTLVSAKINIGRWLMRNRPAIRFQKDFYDEIIQRWEGWSEQAFYISQNPVRSGLVLNATDWPYTASIGHDLKEILGEI